MRLIVGLGNPGSAYQLTRHNVGFLVVQELSAKWGVTFKNDKRFCAKIALGEYEGRACILMMPETFMNLSGEAVQKVASFYKILPEEILVIADDVWLPFGKLRLREKGSSGGHKGFLNIEKHLNTQHFLRLKVGVGSAEDGKTIKDYVLERFTLEELKELPRILEQALQAVDLVLTKGLQSAMNRVNMQEKEIKKDPVVGEEKTT